MGDAVDEELIVKNPVRIKGAGTKKRKRRLRVLTIAELDKIVAAIPERYEALVLLGAWCALRFGELAALRRCDLDSRTESCTSGRPSPQAIRLFLPLTY